MNQEAIEKAVRMSLKEDIGTGDITTQLILPHKLARAPGPLLFCRKMVSFVVSPGLRWFIRK